MNAKGKKNIAELLSVLRSSCFTSDHTMESGHWLQCSSLGISMWVNMCVCVCESIACASVCMSVPVCVQVCVYFGACVVGWWIRVWKVESARHHEVLKEKRGHDPSLPQLPPVERSQPQKSRWTLGAERERVCSQCVHSQSERNVNLWCYKQHGATAGYGAPIPLIPGSSLQTFSLFG